MKIKTANLTGAALDWAVAKCEKEEYIAESGVNGIGIEYEATRYSTDWAQGGPIIERERISIVQTITEWQAAKTNVFSYGPTPLIAAMRCYIASKLGDEVEIPEELK